MPSEIERCLIPDNRVSAVVGITFQPREVVLTLANVDAMIPRLEARFSGATMHSLWTDAADAGDLDLPWDIIGMESERRADGCYKYVLNCGTIELVFDAEWPVVTTLAAQG